MYMLLVCIDQIIVVYIADLRQRVLLMGILKVRTSMCPIPVLHKY
jgi:hypothetical protein